MSELPFCAPKMGEVGTRNASGVCWGDIDSHAIFLLAYKFFLVTLVTVLQ